MKRILSIAAISLSSLSFTAQSCTYDGQFSNPFTESFPGSLDVAIATYEALDSNRIKTISSLNGSPGLMRVSWWLKLLGNKYSTQLQSVNYIYLIDSHLWSKVEGNLSITVHSAPQNPLSTSEVLLISEAALNALIKGELSFDQAINIGIIQMAS